VSGYAEFATLLRDFVARTEVRPLTLREWVADLDARCGALGITPPRGFDALRDGPERAA
jgi:hypothetical protein